MTDQDATAAGRLRYPDFICIGAQKAGTTWLHQKLGQHPDVWLPAVKELHYFDALYSSEAIATRTDAGRAEAALRNIEHLLQGGHSPVQKLERIRAAASIGIREPTDEWYGKIFRDAPADSLCGETTPEYALLPSRGVEHIARLKPAVKIIFIMRDPIDRAWSAMRMMQKRTGKAGATARDGAPQGAKFFERADYAGTIDRFREHVPAANFLGMFFDDLEEQPRQFIEKLCEFLGIEFARGKFKGLQKRVHGGEKKDMDAGLYRKLRDELAPAYERLRASNDPIFAKWYRRHYG